MLACLFYVVQGGKKSMMKGMRVLVISWCAVFLSVGCSPKNQEPTEPSFGPQKVVAYFFANTGSDMWLAERSRPYTLEVHLSFKDVDEFDGEINDVLIKETIAECEQISGGTALGGGTEREIGVALCEGDEPHAGIYWLISEPGELTVRKGWETQPQKIVLTYRMPTPNLRAIAKEEKNEPPIR
jgi:hypothetical protein